MKHTDNIPEIVTSLIKRYPVEGILNLSLGEAVIVVRSNSPDLLNALRTHLKEFLGPETPADINIYALESEPVTLPFSFTKKQPDPGKTRIKEEYVDFVGGRIVRKCLTDMVLLFDAKNHVAVGPCLANVNQVVNFINNRFIEWMLKRGSLLTHAAGVSAKNRGLALAGFSGSGKSTLALQLLSSGVNFVSNDRLMIEKHHDGLRMYGIPKHPRVNPGTILSLDFLHTVMKKEDREAALKLEAEGKLDKENLREKLSIELKWKKSEAAPAIDEAFVISHQFPSEDEA